MEWKERALQLEIENPDLKPTPMFDILRKEYPDEKMTFNQMRSHVRRNGVGKDDPKESAGTVGVIGDLHIPFDHPNYLQFLKDTFKQHKVKRVVSVGDFVDHHALSQFLSETCADSSEAEHGKAAHRAKEYFKAFPKLTWLMGNHDIRPERKAASVGMDKVFLKPMRDLYGIPKGWTIEEEIIIDDVLYKHGINCLGKDGAMNTALQERMSTVIGHSHSFGGCKYSANKRDIIFGLNVGCGIDINAYAFAYGKHAKYRPTLGCGIVFNSSCAMFVPMPEKYFRD